ncbi:TRAP transporter substrate-binding protein [Candidatus Palauibacter sp.]|uniref:TRAP transporter substrate-binding protein n=2 Tax=Candidatus Palauibacter sp. TaxID=3101350 RepID=UPI003B026C81
MRRRLLVRPTLAARPMLATPPRLAATLTTVAALSFGCGGGGESGLVELSLGHVGSPGSLYDVTANEFARRVNERLAGRAELHVYGSSQLGGDDAMLQRLRLGTLDMSLPSTIMSSMVDAFGLFEMPYLVRDREHMKRIEEAVVWPDLAPRAEEAGYRILAVWENGFRHITNSRRPIHGPEDLSGIKLRTPRGVWRVKLFQALGANPTPMPFSEVFVALQTGVMDGQENPLTQVTSAKLHEVQDYLSLTGHVYSPAFVTTGAGRWERHPPEIRAEVEAIAREMQAFVYETAARMDEELLAQLEATEMAINEADPARFEAASEPIYEEFATTVEGGRTLIEKARR